MTVTTATGSPPRIEAITSPNSANPCGSTRSTSTSMTPPQVRPTAPASSSLMP
jgi:hypothetical protein